MSTLPQRRALKENQEECDRADAGPGLQRRRRHQQASAKHLALSVITSKPALLLLLYLALQFFLTFTTSRRSGSVVVQQQGQGPSSALVSRRSLGDDADDEFESPAYIPYLAWYQQLTDASQKVPFVAGLVAWMLFLFAFVGIVASDFFCPCLSTISSYLGLSESVAGSTLLAFGNGSPDVFSTFASMGAHSGSLAIGELLGAASFIISVVAGVMMLVRPFKVTKHVFLRDVAFFMAADVLVCLILYDSHITQLEATGLVLLYVLYVAVVGCSSLWHSRRQRQKELLATARDNYAEDPNSSSLSSHSSPEFTPFLDEDERPPNSPDASTPRSRRSLRQQDYFGDQIEDSSSRPSLRNRSISLAAPAGLSRPRPSAMVRPSLLGAIEFRDVVHSLAQNSSQKALSQFAPISPARTRPRSSTRSRSDYNAASHHNHGHRRATSLAGGVEQLTQNQGPVFDPSVWERPVGSTTPTDLIDLSSGVEDPWRSSSVSSAAAAAGSTPLARPQLSVTTEGPEDGVSRGASALRRVPSIVLTGDDGNVTPMRASSEGSSSPSSARRPAPSRRPSLPAWAQSSDRPAQTRRLLHSFRVHLFPALQDVHQKSYLGLIAGVLSAPAIMMLTLTLPVVDEASFDDSFSEAEEKAFQEAQEDRAHGYEAESEPEDEAERLLWKDRARQRDERIAHRLHSPVAPSHSPSPTSATPPPLNLSELDRQLAERGEADQSVWQWPVDPSSSTGADECGTRTPPSPAPSLSQEARLQSEKQRQTDVKVEKFITVLDCVLCPFFCVLALLGDQLQWWFFLVALGCSVGLGFMAHTIVSDSQCRGRVLFCVVGFLVSMVWLLLTVNEIVGVLQAMGHVFGLSDSILGLTVFALGNSTADLVANWTIAQMGYPVMAISACYGGPLLNTLLGIGLSSTYYIAQDRKPYKIDFDPTLLTTGIGLFVILLATMLVVSANKYCMTRKMGIALLCAYAALTTINVIVEVKRIGHH